jgi:hypothetical protein
MRSSPLLPPALAALVLSSCGGGVTPGSRSTSESADAGVPPDVGPDWFLSAAITYTETGFDLLAVDGAGTAYGVNLATTSGDLWSSSDGRTWTRRGAIAGGASFRIMHPLSNGTLLADVAGTSGHAIARSTDAGATWTQVLALGSYRSLTPHSFAELDGAAYFLEYQVFTSGNSTIRLWRSTDSGATWAVRYIFQGHRHGHGVVADPTRHALWTFFGDTDAQSGTYVSTDAGASWTAIVAGSQDGDIVDATVLSDGSLLCGQDISYLPPRPTIARIGLEGTITHYQTLPSASYSTHAIRAGGYVVGASYEIDTDVSPPGWTRASLWGSADGTRWDQLIDVPQFDPKADVRADVYWELPAGELVINVRNAAGFGPGGVGYLLMRATRRSP